VFLDKNRCGPSLLTISNHPFDFLNILLAHSDAGIVAAVLILALQGFNRRLKTAKLFLP
jgi:hypothetical protein